MPMEGQRAKNGPRLLSFPAAATSTVPVCRRMRAAENTSKASRFRLRRVFVPADRR